jgi:ComF family protein
MLNGSRYPNDPVASAFRRKIQSAFRRKIQAAADALLAVILAPACAACERPLDEPTRGPVCASCWNSIVPITPPICACGDPIPSWRIISVDHQRCPRCRRTGALIARGRAIGEYAGSLRAIVHALKYDGRRTLARELARRLGMAGADVLHGADCAVPVPLHRSRQRTRGFNQAEEIARHLPIRTRNALKRVRATVSQTELPAAQRHANVRNAFRLRRRASVAGLIVVLVDDVSTTGATVDACARVLLGAGAREVRALTAARVMGR